MDPHDRLIVALDTPSLADAEGLAARLDGVVGWFKVGALFAEAGPAAVAALARRGRIFLDMKYHDIPSTVAGEVEAAARQGVSLCTVHALGGLAMLRAARDAAERGAGPRRVPPQVIGVTVLTSLDAAALQEVGIAGTPQEAAVRLARLAQDAGLAGAVTSPLDVAAVRAACGPGFLLVCPGIRPECTASQDQRRVHTPRSAVASGADLLVVGRPITQAPNPRAAAEKIIREIGETQPNKA